MRQYVLTLLALAGVTLGCAAKDAAPRPAAANPREAAVLEVARRRLVDQYPETYRQHLPFVAEYDAVRDLWTVRPAAGLTPGAPWAHVIERPELKVLEIGISQ